MFEEEAGLDYAGGDIRPGGREGQRPNASLESAFIQETARFDLLKGSDNNIVYQEEEVARTEYRGPGSAFWSGRNSKIHQDAVSLEINSEQSQLLRF